MLKIYRSYSKTSTIPVRAHVAVRNDGEHGSGTAAAAGDAPRGDLRTPPERAAENNVVHRGCNCVRVAIIPCVLCYRQPSGFPSGLAVRRVVCKCVIQAIKDKKLNTSKTPPELNSQTHISSHNLGSVPSRYHLKVKMISVSSVDNKSTLRLICTMNMAKFVCEGFRVRRFNDAP